MTESSAGGFSCFSPRGYTNVVVLLKAKCSQSSPKTMIHSSPDAVHGRRSVFSACRLIVSKLVAQSDVCVVLNYRSGVIELPSAGAFRINRFFPVSRAFHTVNFMQT